ncbi:MAG: hypothetical protein SF339_01030 [Blastocatellia bacterium]|nr:hypothetical protein [Blastocatellia bacterium]
MMTDEMMPLKIIPMQAEAAPAGENGRLARTRLVRYNLRFAFTTIFCP